ncbi:MAG: PKD domain-containing protein [Bacteroidetes bacterium]|nr:PKD domain-containing protein [Bacteroidota bacterium]
MRATPVPDVAVTDCVGCTPFHVIFVNNTGNTDSASYFWDFGNGMTSASANPVMDFTNPGFYDVTLTVTNANGCSSQMSYPAMIHVLDTIPPNESKVLSVSVVNDTQVKIIWENNPAIDLAAYVVYRKADYSNTYSVIYTDNNPQNTNYALTSEFTDSGLNTLLKTYTYKVQAIDICGKTIPLDSCKAHTTVNISSQRSGNNIAVNWTPYGGCDVNTYELYRAEPDGPFSYLTTLPGDKYDYLDSTFICPLPYRYKVMATDLCGSTYTSYSDTSQTIPVNTLENQVVDVVRSTVVDNQYVLTEWKQTEVHPEMVSQFEIYRSTDNVNFRYLTTVPPVQTDYIDNDVDVQNTNYYYKILIINTCNIDQDPSSNTSTIVLKGSMDESRMVHLDWTPYKGWDHGVDYYILEKKDDNGHWQLLKQVDGETREYNYQE